MSLPKNEYNTFILYIYTKDKNVEINNGHNKNKRKFLKPLIHILNICK